MAQDSAIGSPLASSFAQGSSLVPESLYKSVSHWIRIPLETAETFLFWRAQMENLFHIHHVADIVDESTPVPSKEIANSHGRMVPNPEYTAWIEKNWIVIGWIQAAVGPSMFPLVMNHSMARDCWKALDVHLSPRRINHLQSIRDELRSMKKSESESMGNFIIKIKALTDNLTVAGDQQKILFVVDGLGPELRLFMSSIHSQPNMLFEDFIHLVSKKRSSSSDHRFPNLPQLLQRKENNTGRIIKGITRMVVNIGVGMGKEIRINGEVFKCSPYYMPVVRHSRSLCQNM